jgi:hypothetical protein
LHVSAGVLEAAWAAGAGLAMGPAAARPTRARDRNASMMYCCLMVRGKRKVEDVRTERTQ